MKKFYSIIALVAMLCTSMCMFTSCGSDDEPEPEVNPVSKPYARYKVKVSEDIFTYFDVTVTIQAGQTSTVYKFDEKTKVADMAVEQVLHERPYPGRIIDIPTFEVTDLPLRFITDIKLSEAGQKLVDSAKANDDSTAQLDFIIAFDYGKCNEKGTYYYSDGLQLQRELPYEGIYVKDLPDFLKVFFQENGKYFDKKF